VTCSNAGITAANPFEPRDRLTPSKTTAASLQTDYLPAFVPLALDLHQPPPHSNSSSVRVASSACLQPSTPILFATSSPSSRRKHRADLAPCPSASCSAPDTPISAKASTAWPTWSVSYSEPIHFRTPLRLPQQTRRPPQVALPGSRRLYHLVQTAPKLAPSGLHQRP
jgi:hypothetical protein